MFSSHFRQTLSLIFFVVLHFYCFCFFYWCCLCFVLHHSTIFLSTSFLLLDKEFFLCHHFLFLIYFLALCLNCKLFFSLYFQPPITKFSHFFSSLFTVFTQLLLFSTVFLHLAYLLRGWQSCKFRLREKNTSQKQSFRVSLLTSYNNNKNHKLKKLKKEKQRKNSNNNYNYNYNNLENYLSHVGKSLKSIFLCVFKFVEGFF